MSLKDTLSKEIINATKAGDKIRLETIRGLRAILLEKEIEKRPNPITSDDEMGVLISSAKKRKESIEMYEKGGRIELAEKEKSELKIIEEFLPKQLTPDEVEAIIKRIVFESGANSQKDFGKVMPNVMKELKGKADGKLISDTVKKLLGG
ncbi:MAG: GatB/YqeY domain-containing protein [Bacteroidota bacterium]|nr:GatB/YqeY domain-containing protein [Bacteroidota bacterium]